MTLKKITLLLISLTLTTFLQAQQLLTKDQQKVRQTVIKFFESLSNRDSLGLQNYCTADVTLFEYGEVWTLDTLIRRAITLNTSTDFKRVNTFEFLNSAADKNTAWATYHLHSEITREGKQLSMHWLESIVLVREKKRWKIKNLHSTLIKRT